MYTSEGIATPFALHSEDINLDPLNVLHGGYPKVWTAIAAYLQDNFEQMILEHLGIKQKYCRQPLCSSKLFLAVFLPIRRGSGQPTTRTIKSTGFRSLTRFIAWTRRRQCCGPVAALGMSLRDTAQASLLVLPC